MIAMDLFLVWIAIISAIWAVICAVLYQLAYWKGFTLGIRRANAERNNFYSLTEKGLRAAERIAADRQKP